MFGIRCIVTLVGGTDRFGWVQHRTPDTSLLFFSSDLLLLLLLLLLVVANYGEECHSFIIILFLRSVARRTCCCCCPVVRVRGHRERCRPLFPAPLSLPSANRHTGTHTHTHSPSRFRKLAKSVSFRSEHRSHHLERTTSLSSLCSTCPSRSAHISMSNSPPSPPPPPPPTPAPCQPPKTPLSELNVVDVINNSGNRIGKPHHNVILSSGECAWATQYPEIQKACFLNRVCQYAPPRELRVQNVEPILQNGPTCGLTALSMIFDGAPSAKALLELAVARGYSRNGEMFSARQLNELFEVVLEENRHLVEYKPVTHTLVGGWMDDANIQIKLRLGSMFLVPYDPDKNHTPCLNRGHRAHWALVVGYLIDQFEDFYVFARHGKTKNLALWSLRDLAKSNANLVEFCQPVGHPNETFILPEGGMGGCNGLLCKFIMIENYKAKDEIVL